MTTNSVKPTNRAQGALALKIEELSASLEQELSEPGAVLDVLIGALAKGQPHPELWQKLHGAASRHDRLAELAFAYEGLVQDRRIKLLQPEQQVELFLHAVEFFSEVFGDADGAISYAERALNAVPNHPVVVEKLSGLLEAQGYHLRLARLYLESAAASSSREEQVVTLWRAARLAEQHDTSGELRTEIYQRILRVSPGDPAARSALERLHVAGGRPRDAARLLEQTLLREPGPSDVEAREVRERLIELYLGELGEPARAMPHVEALLVSNPGHGGALAAAETLLDNKTVAPRAAAALSDAYEKRGDVHNAAAMLTQELKTVRGPRRVEVQRRLALLKQDHLADADGALELLAPVVAGDPGDDELRRRYVGLSLSLDRPLDAARLLTRALQTSRDPAVRARVGAEIGNIYLRAGDPKRAQAAFQQVLEVGQDEGALLEAASRLAELYSEVSDMKPLAHALEVVTRLETQRDSRHKAARRLARLAEGELSDPARAVVAYRALLDSPWVDDALAKLEALFERDGNHDGLVEVIELRAERVRSSEAARELRFRAAELRSTKMRDRASAIRAWEALLSAYGPSRDVHEKLLPLLEQEKRWRELADLLEREVALAPAQEQAAVLARLGQVHAMRLGDVTEALAAFEQALANDPSERTARAALEKLLTSGDARLKAAAVLERVYRREDPGLALLRVLETRGELEPTPEARLAALAEAVRIAKEKLGNPERALEIASRGLREAVLHRRSAIPEWLGWVQEFAGELGDLPGRARHLMAALDEHPVDDDSTLLLARAAGEAALAAGDVHGAVAAYRRALAYRPSSSELLSRMDELLAQQGDPEQRLSLYRSALDGQPDSMRRRELLHASAGLLRRELGDMSQAIATWQSILAEDPRDLAAHQGLVEAFAEQQDWQAVYGELSRMLGYLEGERRAHALRRMAEVSVQQGESKRALVHYRELLDEAELPDEVLEAIEQLARARSDAETLRGVLERRVARALDPEEQAELLERLGDVLASQVGDDHGAVRAWMQSAELIASKAPDEARVRRLYERVLEVMPKQQAAAEGLFEIAARAGSWEKLPALLRVMIDAGGSDREPVQRLLELEAPALVQGAADAFARLVDAVLELPIEPARARLLLLAKARVLAQLPERHQDVDRVYRQLLEVPASDAPAVAEAFEQFLQSGTHPQAQLESRRWLLAWRAEHASDRAAALIAWAHAEEESFGDLGAAARLYERVLELDPDRTDALTELSRLRAAQGDAAGALAALEALRRLSSGEAQSGVELSIAGLLLDVLDQPEQALDVVGPLLEKTPGDPDVLRLVHRALGHPKTRTRAAQLLERTAALADDPEAGAEVLDTLLSISVEGEEMREARGRWYERLLELRAGDPEKTLALALRAADELPGWSSLWDVAEKSARKLNQPEPVAAAYARALERDLTPELAETLGRRMVEFHEEWFEDPDRVVRLLERVLALSPAASWAFDRLKLAFNAAGRWQELFELYDRGLSHAASDPARIELLREAAMAAKDFAGDADRAIGYIERLHALTPGDGRVESSLERLYERHGRTRPLIDLLTARVPNQPTPARGPLELRIATLWLDLNEPLPAFAILDRLFSDGRRDEELVFLLERLVALPASREERLASADGGERTVREAAAQRLIEYHREVGKIGEVVRYLEVTIELAQSPAERVARLRQTADVRVHELGDTVGAFENVSALFALEPRVKEHQERLAELSTSPELHRRRAELLARVALEQAEQELRVELLDQAGQVYESFVGDAARAIELYLDVIAQSGARGPVALHAARQLDPLLLQAARASERCTVLEQRAELETDAEARRLALGNAAEVAFHELGDANRAVSAWRARLRDDGEDRQALDGLCAALERAGRYDELVEALAARARLAADRGAARRDWVRIARLHATERHDSSRAIEAWRVVREEFACDRESFEELAALLAVEARWSELCALLEEEAGNEHDPERRAGLQRRLGEVHRDHTGDALGALRAFVAADDWQRAIEVAGANTADAELGLRVCESLLELSVGHWTAASDGGHPAAMAAAEWAIEELSARLLDAGLHQQMVELLLRGAALPFPARKRRELRREAACLCSDRLNDSERALALFRELFKEEPGDEVAIASVTRLTLLLEERGLDEEIVSLWEEQARGRERSGDHTAAAALWARAAERAEENLGDLERAIADYRNGAGLGGESSLEALARIYEGRGDHQQAAEVLEWLCAQSPREALAERALRLAHAYVSAGLRKRARARLEHAASTAMDAGGVRRKLAELYREAGEWGPLAELLASEAQRASETKTRLSLLREAATLHVEKRREPAAAVPLLEQALELDPDDSALRLTLSDALLRGQRYEEASAVLRHQVERYGNRRPKDRALVHFQLARVALAAGQRGEAITELDIATKIDPAHPGILQALARLAFEEGQLDRAERMYRALLLVLGREGEGEAPSRAEALLDLSEIAVRKDDPLRATEFVESAFETALESAREAEALERALRQRGRHELLARALETRLSTAMAPEQAARALSDLVLLHAGSPEAATPLRQRFQARAETLKQQFLEQGTVDDEAWAALGRIYDWLGDADAEAEILERRVTARLRAAGDDADPEPLYRLAEVRLTESRRKAQGIELLERALSIRPDYARAEKMLREVAEADPEDARTVLLYERVARRSGDSRRLVDALARAAALPDASPELIREGVSLARRLDDLGLAESLLVTALPRSEGYSAEHAAWVRLELAELYEAQRDLGRALELREQAAAYLPAEEARATLLRVARTAAGELSDLARAARLYEQLLAREPADRELWEPLLELHARLGRKEELVRLISQTVPLVDSPSDRARLQLEKASILLDDPERQVEAADVYRQIIADDPKQVDAAVQLAALYERMGRHDELVELLRLQLTEAKDREDVERVVALASRLGELLEGSGRWDEALEAYQNALEWKRNDSNTLEAVLRLAERREDSFLAADAVEGLLAAPGVEAAARKRLLSRLVELRTEQQDGAGVQRALELGFQAMPESAEFRERLIELYAGRAEWDGVARVLEEALRAEPLDVDLRRRLVQAYQRAGELPRAVEVLSGLIGEAATDASLFRERAGLLTELGRSDQALDDLERAYACDPTLIDEYVAALEAAITRADEPRARDLTLRLCDVLEARGDTEAARARLAEFARRAAGDREVLRRLAALERAASHLDAAIETYRQLVQVDEGEALVATARELAELCERAGRPADARSGLERALEVAPEHVELRSRLRDLLIASGANREVARMLLEDARLAAEPSEQVEYLLAAGEWLIAPEGDVARAVEVLERARQLAPDNLEAVVLLARAYAAQQRGDDALQLLGEVVGHYRGRRVKTLAPLYQEMSRIQLEDGMLSDALESLTKAFEMDLRNGPLAMELGRLALEAEEHEVALRAFRTVSMMKAWDSETGEGATSDDKADAHFYLADSARRQGDARKAKILLSKALVEKPEHEAAKRLLAELEMG